MSNHPASPYTITTWLRAAIRVEAKADGGVAMGARVHGANADKLLTFLKGPAQRVIRDFAWRRLVDSARPVHEARRLAYEQDRTLPKPYLGRAVLDALLQTTNIDTMPYSAFGSFAERDDHMRLDVLVASVGVLVDQDTARLQHEPGRGLLDVSRDYPTTNLHRKAADILMAWAGDYDLFNDKIPSKFDMAYTAAHNRYKSQTNAAQAERAWWSAGKRWLEDVSAKEAVEQRKAWKKQHRSEKGFRYSPPEHLRAMTDALGKNDEREFKALKLAWMQGAKL